MIRGVVASIILNFLADSSIQVERQRVERSWNVSRVRGRVGARRAAHYN